MSSTNLVDTRIIVELKLKFFVKFLFANIEEIFFYFYKIILNWHGRLHI